MPAHGGVSEAVADGGQPEDAVVELAGSGRQAHAQHGIGRPGIEQLTDLAEGEASIAGGGDQREPVVSRSPVHVLKDDVASLDKHRPVVPGLGIGQRSAVYGGTFAAAEAELGGFQGSRGTERLARLLDDAEAPGALSAQILASPGWLITRRSTMSRL